jgi:hypothetical protein
VLDRELRERAPGARARRVDPEPVGRDERAVEVEHDGVEEEGRPRHGRRDRTAYRGAAARARNGGYERGSARARAVPAIVEKRPRSIL